MRLAALKQVAVVGHFAFGKTYLDGQTVKTKTVTAELERQFGAERVLTVDTHGGFIRWFSLLPALWRALKECRHVLILPAHNGLKVIAPLLRRWNRRFHRGLHYAVIGGWLPSFLRDKPALTRTLKAFDGVYVETTAMQTALADAGFTNVTVVRNGKALPLLADSPPPATRAPYPLCTFSRVMRQKGIEDAITAVRSVNEAAGETVFTLDIYGAVDPAETAWFDAVKAAMPPYVTYRGCVPFEQSTAVLRDYTALLFPTRFFTEGVPGSVIDAYAAGVPVIAARWENVDDVIDEAVTGFGYTFDDTAALTALLEELAQTPETLAAMRKACLVRAVDFLPENALQALVKALKQE